MKKHETLLVSTILNGTYRGRRFLQMVGMVGLFSFGSVQGLHAEAVNPSADGTEVVQQKKNVTGVVKDKTGEPVIGANVIVKGTTSGVITDIDGRFTISAGAGQVIEVSFIGFKTYAFPVDSKSEYTVVLQDDAELLEEVVVVGYGSQLKRSVTGAISSVKSEELEAPNAVSADNLLQGKVAGLTITQNSAQPGSGMSVNIRGKLSPNGSNSPLYVIDGVVISSTGNKASSGGPNLPSLHDGSDRSPLATLNPNDILSIDVMKDASAAAIYGSSAANGVILITTKKGQAGKPRISYNGSFSVQGIKKYYDVLNAQEYMTNVNLSRMENFLYRGNFFPYGPEPAPASGWAEAFTAEEIRNAKTYDHVDEITRTGFIHNHNVAINAGSEKFKFYASFNYYDQNSILKISDLQRFSGRFNFEANFNKYVTLNVASMYSHLSSNNPSSGHTRMNCNEAVQTNAAIFFPSNMPLYDEEGKLTTSISPLTPNPATWFHIKNQTVTKRLMFSPNLEVKFLPWLKANVQLSVDKTDENREIFGSTKGKLPAQVEDNYGGFSNAFNDNYGIEEYLTFDKDIANGHHLNAVVGTGYYVTTSRSHNVMGYNFPTDVYENNNIGSTSDLERTNLGSWKTWRNKLSFFGRLNYTFKNRYILGVTLRNDGSSVFADNHKWGWFPGASAAWIISEEKFMKDFDVLSFLKLRAGYGTSGNESILTGGTYPLTTYGNAWSGDYYYFGGVYHKGIIQKEQGNPDLKWETDITVNAGIDFGFFDDRLTGSVDYYVRTAKDLLNFTPLPVTGMVGNIAKNVGSTRSKGIEVALKGTVIDKKDWTLTAYANVSHNRSKWVERNPEVAISPWLDEKDDISPIYGWKTNGIFHSLEEIQAYTSNGKVLQPDAKPGNLKYVDVNGDGVMDDGDIVKLGTWDPKANFGLGASLRFRNWMLDIDTYGVLGKKAYDSWNFRGIGDDNTSVRVKDVWTSYNPTGWYPGIAADVTGGNNKTGTHDFTLKNVHFWRFKDIKLTYMLPEKFLKRNKIASDASVFVDLQNTLMLTNYEGLDPEMEINCAPFPIPFTVVLGVNINF